jgi:predicted phage terminase large subunit-like protein
MTKNYSIPPIDQIEAELCRRSFYYFVQYFWDTIINEDPVWNWHIKEICDELQEIGIRVKNREPKLYDLIINVPPGSSKSTIATEMYPAWCWAIDPTQRFLCGSYTDAISNDLAEKCRTIIQSDKYRKLFPEIALTTSNITHLQNSKRGERYTTSTGGSATGLHAHQIIIDDPLNPKKAASDTERENANKWISGTLSTRKVNKEITPTILIMQRLHEQDPTGYLLDRWKRVKHICLPAEISDLVKPEEYKNNYTDGLLDPKRLSALILEESKSDLGSYAYAGQFDQNPAPAEGGIFKKDWFSKISLADYENIKKHISKDVLVDGAYTDKTENDPCGFMASGVYRADGRLYIERAVCKHLEFPEFTRYTVQFTQEAGFSKIRGKVKIEPKASGISAVQSLRKNTTLPVMNYTFPKNGKVSMNDSKVTRAHAASPFVESGRVVLVEGNWNQEFLDQCGAFPNAAHDEYVDLLVMAVVDAYLRPSAPELHYHN